MLKKTVVCLFVVMIAGCSTSKTPYGQYVKEHDFSDGHIEYWGKKYDITADAVTITREKGATETFGYDKNGNFLHLKTEAGEKASIVLEIINKNTLIERIDFGKKESSDNIFIRYKRIETVELNEAKEKSFSQE